MRVDPRTKLFAIMSITSLAIYYRNWVGLVYLLILASVLCVVFKADYKTFINKMKRFLYMFLFISLLQIIFVRSGAPLIVVSDVVLATTEGINRGISLGLRVMIIFSSAAIMAGENSRNVIASFSKMKVPYLFSFMLMITLRFLPIYMESFTDAITALQLRGINLKKTPAGRKIKLYGHLLLPVVSDSVIKSQELAMTMEARGFGAMKKRTNYLQVRMSWIDYVVIFILAKICILLTIAYSVGLLG